MRNVKVVKMRIIFISDNKNNALLLGCDELI
jgi:hypothetical protein